MYARRSCAPMIYKDLVFYCRRSCIDTITSHPGLFQVDLNLFFLLTPRRIHLKKTSRSVEIEHVTEYAGAFFRRLHL